MAAKHLVRWIAAIRVVVCSVFIAAELLGSPTVAASPFFAQEDPTPVLTDTPGIPSTPVEATPTPGAASAEMTNLPGTPTAASVALAPVYILGDGVPDELVAAIRLGVESAVGFWEERLGARPRQLRVYIDVSQSSLVQHWADEFALAIEDVPFPLPDLGREAGTAKVDSVWIYAPGSGPDYEPFVAIAAHEYFHAVQIEMARESGTFPPKAYPQLGVDWLTDGSALWETYLVLASISDSGLRAKASQMRQDMLRAAQQVATPLWDLEISNGLPAPQAYTLGWAAVEQLVARYGLTTLGTYYRGLSLGQGLDGGRAAFQSAFGESLGNFYAEFEASRPRSTGVSPPVTPTINPNLIAFPIQGFSLAPTSASAGSTVSLNVSGRSDFQGWAAVFLLDPKTHAVKAQLVGTVAVVNGNAGGELMIPPVKPGVYATEVVYSTANKFDSSGLLLGQVGQISSTFTIQ